MDAVSSRVNSAEYISDRRANVLSTSVHSGHFEETTSQIKEIPPTKVVSSTNGAEIVSKREGSKESSVSQQALQQVRDFFEKKNVQLSFSKDKETGIEVVRFLDKENKVVKQLPAEEMLRISRAIDNFLKNKSEWSVSDEKVLSGMLLNERV